MKRVIVLTLLLALLGQAAGQRGRVPQFSPGYMFPPLDAHSTTLNVPIATTRWAIGCSFIGDAYRSPMSGHGGTYVYGVAVTSQSISRYPYLWIYVLEDTPLDSTSSCCVQDTVAAELFCFVETPPVSYADFEISRPSGPVLLPFYEFYFSKPVFVPAGKRFYVGMSHSPFNVTNHDYDYYMSHTIDGLKVSTPRFYLQGGVSGASECVNDCYQLACDGVDSVWGMIKHNFPGRYVDWACGSCIQPMLGGQVGKYKSYMFMPIVRPPEDSSLLLLPHHEPLRPGKVEGLRVANLDPTHATLAWDTLPTSSWGVVGANADAYQVSVAPALQEWDEGMTLMATEGGCGLDMAFDSSVMYKVRCRARSRHACDIHDTLVWGNWSDVVYFHTGVVPPDSVRPSCARVEGLRYLGHSAGGPPKFEWEAAGQDRFEVQYAPWGSSSWRRGGTTSSTPFFLRTELDPGHYWLRVRAVCDHRCPIHDTTMWAEWSDTVEFEWGQADTVGIGERGDATGEGLFVLAPNPARGTVTVTPMMGEGECPAVLTVTDAKGSEVMRRTLAESRRLTLETSTLPAGAYLVTLTTRTRRSGTQRLVVER